MLRIILEAAAEPEDGTVASLSDKDLLRTLYAICLVDKCTAGWIEPLLYRAVVLESENQVISFSYALKCKSSEFLSRSVRALWVLHSSEELDHIDSEKLFSTLRRLESLALPGDKLRLLGGISSPSPIRDLILISPPPFIGCTYLRHLTLRSLHVIDPVPYLTPNAIPKDMKFADELYIPFNAIPRICLDYSFSKMKSRNDLLQPAMYSGEMAGFLYIAEKLQEIAESSVTRETKEPRETVQPRSLWVKHTIERRSIPPSTRAFSVDIYTQAGGPSNRPAYSEIALVKPPQNKGLSKRSRPQSIKEMIRYNEVHWDRVAEWCEAERVRKEAEIMA